MIRNSVIRIYGICLPEISRYEFEEQEFSFVAHLMICIYSMRNNQHLYLIVFTLHSLHFNIFRFTYEMYIILCNNTEKCGDPAAVT